MTNDAHARRRARLLSAVSVLGVSLGVTLSATAAGAADSSQIKIDGKPESHQLKYQSGQLKYDSQYLKHQSNQQKADANYLKYDTNQQKGSPNAFNPQPDPPGKARGGNVQ
jgi:hypothetical protein